MSCRLVAICFDANDPAGLARFWAELLGCSSTGDDGDGVVLRPADDTPFALRFRVNPLPKLAKNQMHFDLTSASLLAQQQTVARALGLGARHTDVGQRPEEGHVVLADPEDNEFCVIEAGNRFLADCGFLGAVAGDGSQRVGHFWSQVLEWPLVWEQDQETAIRSPRGGPKITWGGVLPEDVRNSRLHFDVAADAGADRTAEVGRLLDLGASRIDADRGAIRPAAGAIYPADGMAEWTDLADPDGNRFRVFGAGSI